MKNIIRYWMPLYVYAGIIFYFSSLPHPVPSISIPYFDKALHIIEYTCLGFLAARAFKNSSRKAFYERFKMLAILAAVLYGISDEIHQAFVPFREFSVFDIIADMLGGMLGVFIYGTSNTF